MIQYRKYNIFSRDHDDWHNNIKTEVTVFFFLILIFQFNSFLCNRKQNIYNPKEKSEFIWRLKRFRFCVGAFVEEAVCDRNCSIFQQLQSSVLPLRSSENGLQNHPPPTTAHHNLRYRTYSFPATTQRESTNINAQQ